MSSVPRRLARKYVPREAVRRARAVRDAVTTPAQETGRARPAGPVGKAGGQGAAAETEPLIAALREGRSLTVGLVAEVRDRLAAEDLSGATAMAASLRKDPATAAVGALCFGIVSAHREFLELAWHELSSVPRELWARHAASEYVRAGVDQDVPTMLREVEALVDEEPPYMNAKRWMAVLEPLFGAGEMALAGRVFGVLDTQLGREGGGNEKLTVRRDWMRRWIDRSPDSPTAPAPDADVAFAIMDYDHPGRSRASANIGDHVQTLASLGHLVRHQDLSYEGPQDLVDLVTHLRGRVRPERRRHGHDARVQVLTVDRDASMYTSVPEGTWTLAFGWYMHALFGVRYGFPFHRNLQPIFVSFHCNKRSLLTPEAIEYLRAHGPIGCRDWTTVDILLSVDVPAFFSGCLTTTVNTTFPDLVDAFPASAPVAYVDTVEPAPEGASVYKHSYDGVRFRSFTGNMYDAIDLLETYRRDHSALVTSRLHCYLPMRSIGASVDFRPKNRSDIRFAGLIDIDDDEFEAIRTGINDRLEKVFDAILQGGSREEVYALWGELCADDVALAHRRREAPSRPATPTDLGDELRRAVAASRTVGTDAERPDTVHVAVRVEQARPQVLNVLVDSLVTHAAGPLHLWLLDSSGDGVDVGAVAQRAAGHTVTVVPTATLGADLRGIAGKPRGRSRAGLDLLALPELLPGVDRVVVLPVHALVEADVAELAALDLGEHAVAAPDVAGTPDASGFGVIHSAGNRLGPRTTVATELRRRTHARHTFDFTAFDIDVLVLDLARLRADGLVREAVLLVEEFGLTVREVLHVHVGPHRAVVPPAWHVVPTRVQADDASLLHWVDEAKPWTRDYAPAQDRWLGARREMRSRLTAAR